MMLGMYGNVKMSPEGDTGNGTPATVTTAPTDAGATPKHVPYERFKEVNDRLRALEEAQSQAETTRKAQEEAKLLEQKEFETLANQYKTELEQERLNRLRLEIASKAGLPVEFAARLQGADETALQADAEALKGFLKPSTPGVPPGPTRSEVVTFSREQMSDPEWVLKHEKEILAAAQAARQ